MRPPIDWSPRRLELRAFQILSTVVCHGTRMQFERDAGQAAQRNRDVLLEILRRNQGCEYGVRHDFASMRHVDDYLRRVPVITYADIEEQVTRMAAGERNVLCSEDVDHFMLTSGTSRAPKLIPSTKLERRRRVPFFAFLPWGTVARTLGTDALLGRGMNGMSIASSNRRTSAGIPVSSSLRIGLGESTWLMERLWVSPVDVYRVADVEDAYYLHWLFAVRERDLTYVSDEFASKMAYALTLLKRHWESLAKDVAAGTITRRIELPADVRRRLEARLSPDPRRADDLRRAFEAAPGGDGVLGRIWPKLRYVACIYTGTFGVYEERIRRFAGELPIFNVAYGCSECNVATAYAPNDPRYVLSPRSGFFEFIRESDISRDRPDTFLLDELEPGERYELVVTNFAGLYRYRTADVVEVVGYHREAPLLEFRYRANVLMNLNAEMMTEYAAAAALRGAAARVGVELVDHTLRADTEAFPPRYVFYVETVGPASRRLYRALDRALDEALREVNPRYADRIDRGRLQKSALRWVESGSFEELSMRIAARAQARGISAVQTKIPRLIEDEALQRLLDTHSHAFGDAEDEARDPRAAAVPA